MGSSQSVQLEEPHQRLLETLRAMDFNKNRQQEEKEYVMVQEKLSINDKPRDATSIEVSVSSLQAYEKELLQDPKVAPTNHGTLHY